MSSGRCVRSHLPKANVLMSTGRVGCRNTFIFNYKEFIYFIYKFTAPTCSEFVFPSPLTSITPIDFTDLF